jgi:hypothetical protein
MIESLLRVLILMAVVVAVVFSGWNEPLRYRFLSPDQIAAEEQAIRPFLARESPHQWRPAGTSLDRAPYEVQRGVVYYSDKFDPKRMGSSTETPWRPNTYGGDSRSVGAGR